MKIDQFPTEQQHPVFVFGTLRPGHGNSRTWQGVAHPAHDGEATIADHRLVTNGGFPYCLPAEGETTTGTLIVPFPENYELAMHYMDSLEGFPLHYNRKTIEVTTPLGTVTAWYYIPDDWSYYANLAQFPATTGTSEAHDVPRWRCESLPGPATKTGPSPEHKKKWRHDDCQHRNR